MYLVRFGILQIHYLLSYQRTTNEANCNISVKFAYTLFFIRNGLRPIPTNEPSNKGHVDADGQTIVKDKIQRFISS